MSSKNFKDLPIFLLIGTIISGLILITPLAFILKFIFSAIFGFSIAHIILEKYLK